MHKDDINALANRLADLLPRELNQTRQELGDTLAALLRDQLGQMGWVRRDAFEAQAAVLQRTRDKLTQLEQRLDRLEAPVTAGDNP